MMVSVQMATLVVALAGGGETVLLDFHAPWCAPCRAMEGTIAGLERAGYPVRKVDIDQQRHLARQYNVQSVPCFVLLVDGREAGRLTGAVRSDELEGLFARAGVRRGTAQRKLAPAPSSDPPLARLGNRLARNRSQAAPVGANTVETSGRAPAVAPQDLVPSNVRLTITDPQGTSYGSGTIIDARQGEALVLTCGHIFRDSQGKGEITVDLCGDGAPQKLPGRLLRYDLQNDVGLVSIKSDVPLRVAPLAPKGYQPRKGDRVITVGCNNGGPATAQETTITAINKFLGPSNLQVAGLPVQGRSGGGLFSSEGLVLGVCNAADPADNEGLYAALAVIHEELDAAGLTAIYASRPPAEQLAGPRQMPGPAAETRSMPGQPMPLAAVGGGAGLNEAEQAALAELHSKGEGAEVICIVRSLEDPRAKSEVIMLDRASPAFLRQLTADREAQDSRHLTSLKVRSASQRPAPAVQR